MIEPGARVYAIVQESPFHASGVEVLMSTAADEKGWSARYIDGEMENLKGEKRKCRIAVLEVKYVVEEISS